MELKISKQLPEFSATGNNTRLCCVVEFPNCISTTTQKSFKWIPSWKQLAEIEKTMVEVEKESWGKTDTQIQELKGGAKKEWQH